MAVCLCDGDVGKGCAECLEVHRLVHHSLPDGVSCLVMTYLEQQHTDSTRHLVRLIDWEHRTYSYEAYFIRFRWYAVHPELFSSWSVLNHRRILLELKHVMEHVEDEAFETRTYPLAQMSTNLDK